MKKIEPILERLRDKVGAKTDKELCEKVKIMVYATLDTWKNRDRIPPDKLRLIAKEVKVDPSWLEFGEEISTNNTESTNSIPHQMISAPIMSIKASAGSGREQHEIVTTGELLIDRILFKVLPNLKYIRAIEVEGDSMYPTLKDGDYVVIEENSNFSGDGIYVLQYDGVLLVKRLQADIDGIEILSDNQSYGKRKYDPNDDQRLFHIAGKVILRMQR